jgi:hypothetical protein
MGAGKRQKERGKRTREGKKIREKSAAGMEAFHGTDGDGLDRGGAGSRVSRPRFL